MGRWIAWGLALLLPVAVWLLAGVAVLLVLRRLFDGATPEETRAERTLALEGAGDPAVW